MVDSATQFGDAVVSLASRPLVKDRRMENMYVDYGQVLSSKEIG